MKTNILLGAGFSLKAGYPSGQMLNQKFFSNVEKKILRQSSSEWMWDEYDEATSNNGRLNSEHLNISYLLSELVEAYQKETSQFFDYEEFYDWFLKNYDDKDLIKQCCDRVNSRLKKEFNMPDTSRHYFKQPDINEYRTIREAYNYLIADLLQRPYDREKTLPYYSQFIDLIKNSSETNIFTINHDTLVEFLLDRNNIKYSDGFSVDNSIIAGESNQILEMFSDHYSQNTRIYKLHGSINYYLFTELKSNEGGVYSGTGNYWFFKPNTYWNKHNARKIDPQTGAIIQALNSNILPQFLTGKSKMDVINTHSIYKHIYAHFANSFGATDRLVIIGYSYRDKHINEIIKKAVDSYDFYIVNINPGMPFPFRRNYSKEKVINLRSIEEFHDIVYYS